MLLTMGGIAIFAAAGFTTYTAVQANRTPMSNLTRQNLEALTQNENNDDKFYKVARYDISQRFKVTSVSGSVSVSIGALLSVSEASSVELKGKIEGEYVNCHKRYCLDTTVKQAVECIADSEWCVCSTFCNHTNNQM